MTARLAPVSMIASSAASSALKISWPPAEGSWLCRKVASERTGSCVGVATAGLWVSIPTAFAQVMDQCLLQTTATPLPYSKKNTFRVIALPPMIHPWVRVTLNWAISTTPLNFGHLPNLKSAMVVALSIGRQLRDHLISFVLDRLLVGVHNQVLISHGAREGFPRRSSWCLQSKKSLLPKDVLSSSDPVCHTSCMCYLQCGSPRFLRRPTWALPRLPVDPSWNPWPFPFVRFHLPFSRPFCPLNGQNPRDRAFSFKRDRASW